ncbi:hypothetical protein [Lignipirellula cremea]|uniref:Uncharacterized protein n=1 Tax=Lignipirellula cremea TaxID=2528010 RepID=A0A518DPH7_9BACT|nr:hypothetical protein [Lignipirellula cremea]QDU93713.1 hypothetical protein Pla8534_14940 [Lignipirellula cremea]
MAKKSKKKNEFTGRWRITWMDQWDQDYVDDEVEGFIEFDRNGLGSFHFACVQGQMDCRLTTRDGKPAIEFSWDGNDEMDAAIGRGWAVVKDSQLEGMLFFHFGDESEFRAVKAAAKRKRRK